MSPHRKDFYYVVGFMIVLFFLWLLTGGYQRAKETGESNDPLVKPLQPIDSGQTYNPF